MIERERFLDLAQHKLKTPIAVLAGWASTLDQWELLTADERAEGLAAIQRATTELHHQIEDVLEEARIQLLVDSLRPEPLLLGPFLADLLAGLERDEDAHPTTLEAEEGVTALVDREALARILAELLDNARKYSPDGGAIHVTVLGGPPPRIVVRDRGIGLGDDVDVFAPFERASNARTVVRGTGLGLHIVRSLVTAMGGSVSAAAAADSGTVVTVELPAPR